MHFFSYVHFSAIYIVLMDNGEGERCEKEDCGFISVVESRGSTRRIYYRNKWIRTF